jgi:hypothetical protein
LTSKLIHIIGIVPDDVTAWCRMTVPRSSIFGDEPSAIEEWDYGQFSGSWTEQAVALARYARETQSLDYLCGPALVLDDETEWLTSMLMLLQYQNQLGDATLHVESNASHITDERLKGMGLLGPEPIRDATRHAIAGLKLARENPTYAKELWPR